MTNNQETVFPNIESAAKEYVQNFKVRKFYDKSEDRWCFVQHTETCFIEERLEPFLQYFSNAQLTSPLLVRPYGTHSDLRTHLLIVSALEPDYLSLRELQSGSVDAGTSAFPLDAEWREKVFYNMIQALAELHRQSVAHRWLTDKAFFVNPEACVILGDWWKYELEESYSKYACRIRRGEMLERISPEQWTASDDTPPSTEELLRIDVFALGVIGYHLLFDSFPFEAHWDAKQSKKSNGIKEKILSMLSVNNKEKIDSRFQLKTAAKENLMSCTEKTREILSRCLATDPQKRYPSASIIVNEVGL